MNSVDFDWVCSQSSSTPSFGPPDILSVSTHDVILGQIHGWSNDKNNEDPTKSVCPLKLSQTSGGSLLILPQELAEVSPLDTCGLDRSSDVQLFQDNTVFFLRFSRFGVTGHSHRSHSASPDRFSERLVSQSCGDEETAFVFAADHGTSKIGNHGNGGTLKPSYMPTQTSTSTRLTYNPVSQTPTTLEPPSLPGVETSGDHCRTN